MRFEADSICIDRGIRQIIQNVSFALDEGEALIVTGANGAGKSTLLRGLCSLLPLSGGTIKLEGIGEDEQDAAIISQYIHYLGPKNAMKASLTVKENLEFWQQFCASGSQDAIMSVEEALGFVKLEHVIDLPFSYLSTGMKRRAAIARLLITDKPVWMVDEPTSGLDAHSSEIFTQLCKDYCDDGGILIAATHLPLPIPGAKALQLQASSKITSQPIYYDSGEPL